LKRSAAHLDLNAIDHLDPSPGWRVVCSSPPWISVSGSAALPRFILLPLLLLAGARHRAGRGSTAAGSQTTARSSPIQPARSDRDGFGNLCDTDDTGCAASSISAASRRRSAR
jgi:hypothetical protein